MRAWGCGCPPTEFLWTGSQWTLTDKGSSNGTTVNGVKLVEEEPVEVYHGAVIMFGPSSEARVEVCPYIQSRCNHKYLHVHEGTMFMLTPKAVERVGCAFS
eukprot:6741629-Pyramimonas_sp.AAC.1